MYYILAFIVGLLIVLIVIGASKKLHFLKYSNGSFILDSRGNKIPCNTKNEALTKNDYISPYQKKIIKQNDKARKKTNNKWANNAFGKWSGGGGRNKNRTWK